MDVNAYPQNVSAPTPLLWGVVCGLDEFKPGRFGERGFPFFRPDVFLWSL